MRDWNSSSDRETAVWSAACWLLGAHLMISSAGAGLDGGMFSCGFALLVSGAGLWFRQIWAKYAALFSAAVFGLLTISINGFTAGGLILLLAVVVGMLLLWKLDWQTEGRTPDDEDADLDDGPVTSLVALLPESCYLDAAILARLATQAWQVEVGLDDDDEPYAVTGESPHFLIRAEDRLLVVHNVPEPFFEEPQQFASRILESRVSRAVLENRAWMSVNVLDVESDPADSAEAYRLIGRLLAELIDDDCLAIYCPETGSINPYRAGCASMLRSEDPLAALRRDTFPPVIHIDEDDPRMKAAVETARRTFPEFVRAFENRESDQSFSVKAPLCDSTGCEQIWISVTAIENDVIYGTVGNEPVRLTRYKFEDRARVAYEEISDWMYFDDGELHGGFTIEVLSRVAAERARRDPPTA